MDQKYSCNFFRGSLSEVWKISLYLIASLAITLLLLIYFNAVDLFLYIFPVFVLVFLVYFLRFRFNKNSALYDGYFTISNQSLLFNTPKGDLFKNISFSDLAENIQFKHIFSYDEKNIQALLKFKSGETWTLILDSAGADAIKNLKWEVHVDSKALKKIPFYMHFTAIAIMLFYGLMAYFYITKPEEIDVRNILLVFTTLPVLAYYFKLRKEIKNSNLEK